MACYLLPAGWVVEKDGVLPTASVHRYVTRYDEKITFCEKKNFFWGEGGVFRGLSFYDVDGTLVSIYEGWDNNVFLAHIS